MLVDGGVGFGIDREGVGRHAAETEADGYHGAWAPETGHDPFLPLLLASQHTERLELGTGIAVAFARNPMTLAMLANDLQLYSKGRFLLGLGSQIQPHIEKRYSMPWSNPAPRMREMILAMRAIWSCWNEGTRLNFQGRFYRHTLMTPFFNPGSNPYGPPKVFLAAVGERMTEVAGEVADGLLVHGFTTERYLREVTLPALDRGLARSRRTRSDVQIAYPGFVVTGDDEPATEGARMAVKAQIAFYGSTPAYKPVLDLHGWGDLQLELNALSKKGDWGTMAGLVDDEMLDAFAVVAPPEGVAPEVLRRFDGVVDRFGFYAPYPVAKDRWRAVLAALTAG